MDFPIFHLDLLGNRLLIAIIAIFHVLINHTFAVGFLPLVVFLEYRGVKERQRDPTQASAWDALAKKLLFVAFIITTSLGALTGVGIWLSTAVVNPNAIGSLIRVFFGAWLTEWVVFVLEVIFIMTYFLLWDKSNENERYKRRHLIFGACLAIFSWLTMAIIVAILGFMMAPGHWNSQHSFWHGLTNPLYLPQLYFRTPLAMMLGGAAALLLIPRFLKKGDALRNKAISFTSLWLLIWTPAATLGGIFYYLMIPKAMVGNLPTAVTTKAFLDWYASLQWIMLSAILVSLIVALLGLLRPRWVWSSMLIIPLLTLGLTLGSFERIREFVRKPFIIGEYMYANGLRVVDYPRYQREGLLANANYLPRLDASAQADPIEQGKQVFLLACSRCHTVGGINSVVTKFQKLLPLGETLQAPFITAYIPNMHKVWYYMPPFPGNAAELQALAEFIVYADRHPVSFTQSGSLSADRNLIARGGMPHD